MPTGTLPKEAKALWEKVYDESKSAGDDEEKAAKKAWGAVRSAGWKKNAEDVWVKMSQMTEFSFRIERAAYDKATNERRWKCVASDTDEDDRNDSMSLELFNDFVSRIEQASPVPEEFRSNFWQGGMPYLSVSHYPDLDGFAVPGPVDAVYVDGTRLKSKGRFSDTPLGRACFESVCASLYGKDADRGKVRISIAFLDWAHKHKSNGYVFERKSLGDFCPECIKEMQKSEFSGKIYLKGQLVHLALTRVPVNTRTVMEVEKSMAEEIRTREEDAASIVGEDLARELNEKSSMVDKSAAVVIKSDGENAEATPEPVVEDAKTTAKDVKDKANEDLSDDEKQAVGFDGSEDDEEEEKSKKKAVKKSITADTEIIRSIVSEAVAEAMKVPAEPVHPLDAAVSAFKAAYDIQIAQSIPADDKLKGIQTAFNDLGTAIIETVKSSSVEAPQPSSDGNTGMAEMLSKALQPLYEKIEILNAQLADRPAASNVPQRRSIAPTPEMQLRSTVQQAPKSNSPTPKLAELISKTVP